MPPLQASIEPNTGLWYQQFGFKQWYAISPESTIEDDAEADEIENASIYLYGLIHARYILTLDGLEEMVWFWSNCSIIAREVQGLSFWLLLSRFL